MWAVDVFICNGSIFAPRTAFANFIPLHDMQRKCFGFHGFRAGLIDAACTRYCSAYSI